MVLVKNIQVVRLALNYKEGIVTRGGIVHISLEKQNTQVLGAHEGYSFCPPLPHLEFL